MSVPMGIGSFDRSAAAGAVANGESAIANGLGCWSIGHGSSNRFAAAIGIRSSSSTVILRVETELGMDGRIEETWNKWKALALALTCASVRSMQHVEARDNSAKKDTVTGIRTGEGPWMVSDHGRRSEDRQRHIQTAGATRANVSLMGCNGRHGRMRN
jgi:hypothetical protein